MEKKAKLRKSILDYIPESTEAETKAELLGGAIGAMALGAILGFPGLAEGAIAGGVIGEEVGKELHEIKAGLIKAKILKGKSHKQILKEKKAEKEYNKELRDLAKMKNKEMVKEIDEELS